MMLEGVLPIWKPEGFTSHDVVAKARRILKIKRIGHTGTLDPMVTGVLPLCVGRATRLVEYIQEMPKEYEAQLIVGLATDTEDLTGTVLEEADRLELDGEKVKASLASFVGGIMQVPPMYSAVKVDGKRLYELARQGQAVERKPRPVTIYGIDLLSMDLERPKPEIRFRARCSKGTYIRTLCVDIGRSLGYPAAMGELVRTSTGGFTREQCVTLEELADLAAAGEEAVMARMVPSDRAVSFLPSCVAGSKEALAAIQGKKVSMPSPFQWVSPSFSMPDSIRGLVRLYDGQQRFLGLFRLQEDGQTLVAEKVFLPGQDN